MKALIQRVSQASVSVAGEQISAIGPGMLVLLAVEATDTPASLSKLVHKVAHYRLFGDSNSKMNLNVQQIAGAVLVVSQFTLAADTQNGLRPSFTPAADPAMAEQYYLQFNQQLAGLGIMVQRGRFGADMQVSLTNDGPVTFLLTS
ncbi:D-tyrosyl-tRNA(Tyr) deacylase [Arsukibacterium ikkense]|uniref:D-aminoacyl-tRNA deacylase n=1 Tax=Arsukibacterium ikkense TaxID=336831 RepID=A0A0M2V6V2_9GAMM|nr:D-aminoacyl-tRNA deacylase [Arsukibacterium ikkense]KKO46361.1 D-tyrosyl-tRNA(Tyr) deacylase [Arsukibacterium ikkense]